MQASRLKASDIFITDKLKYGRRGPALARHNFQNISHFLHLMLATVKALPGHGLALTDKS